MRIAMIAPLEMRVPPIAYGGSELVVSLLTEELVSRGQDVTLFASGDSISQARLESVCPHSLRGSDKDKGILNLLNVVSCLERADQFDIIHNHTTVEGMSTAGLVNTPVLTTLHGDLNGDFRTLFTHYKGWYNTISRSAQSLLPEKERFAGVIYNAIDCASYPFNGGERDDYLLYLSRISPEKGTHLAIQVARKLGRRLIIAGNVDAVDQQYFQSQVSPQIDGKLIQFVGEADYAIKRGSAPEVVCHGVTGFVVNTLEEMMDAIGQVNQIEPKRCREHVELRFDVPRMAGDYIFAYQQILEAEGKWSRSAVVSGLSAH